LISVAVCTLLYSQVKSFLSAVSITDTEIDAHAVEQLLKLAQAHPSGAFPQDNVDPSIKNAFMGESECWHMTQKAVSRNGKNYTISANDPFRATGRDVDNSLVEVQFQDGSKIGFTFYQQTMVGCTIEPAEVK
jgi:hypothetical protein